jgi:hypothetical protein
VTASAVNTLTERWPTWAGIGISAWVGLNLSDGTELAAVLPAMAIIYLGATALRRPSAAWPLAATALLVIAVTDTFWVEGDATWVLLILAVPLLAYGIWSEVQSATDGVWPQAIAMVGFGAAAAIALGVSEDAGAYLVAAGFLGHAAWDAYHHWANEAVVRSYAEACCVADTLIAIAIVIATA